MKEWIRKTAKAILCHRAMYGGLCGCHSYAALATGKPEIYLPMAALYLALAVMPK